MTAKIIKWPHPTAVPLPPERVLNDALTAEFESVVVMGFLKNGDEYIASNHNDGGEVVWLMERAKHMMMQWVDEHGQS